MDKIKEKCVKCGHNVSVTIIVISLVLAGFKFWVGYISKSHALMAAAFYSLQYVITAIMVVWGTGRYLPTRDLAKPHGSGKLEYIITTAMSLFIIASMLVMLFIVGTRFLMGPSKPTMLAFWGALISLVATYIMAGYLKCAGNANKSPALLSNAHHLHMDTISAACLTVAIIITIMGMRHLDPLVAAFEAIHIIFTSGILFRDGIKGLMDSSLPDVETRKIKRAIVSTPGVMGLNYVRTRELGRQNQVDCEIQLAADETFDNVNAIKKGIRGAISKLMRVPTITNISIAPVEVGNAEEQSRTERVARVLARYYTNFIESHQLVVGEQSINLTLTYQTDIAASLAQSIRGRIKNELQREIPGLTISVKMDLENYSNQKEVAYD